MKQSKFENLVWIIFASIGATFVIIGTFICFYMFNNDNKIETTGTIEEITYYRDSDGDTSHQVYVSYTVKGKEYQSKLNGYSSSFYEGKEIDIYYDENNPNKIGMKSLDLLYLIFPGIGMIFVIIGGTGLIVRLRKKNLEKSLKENNTPIYADYVETIINRSYAVNNRYPYNIICEWNNPSDGKIYIFKSKNIWINPEKIIEENSIKKFAVYMDSGNPKKYLVDVDILTENIVDLS